MTDISENDIQVVRKWLDGGCPSWAVPVDQIRKLCSALAALEAENERLRAELKKANSSHTRRERAERVIEGAEAAHAALREGREQQAVACATDGCDNPATNQFIRGGVGSMYCGDCFAKVVEVCGHGIPDYFGSLVDRARDAAAKASTKFPQPNYVTLKIAEEAGEVVRGAVHYAEGRMEWSEVEGEIVQLIAMLIRFVTEGDQINGITPPARAALAQEGK